MDQNILEKEKSQKFFLQIGHLLLDFSHLSIQFIWYL